VTFDRVVENTRTLFEAALGAGGGRSLHFSVGNPSHDSELPYFRSEAQAEELLASFGVPYAVIRPTLVYGEGDLLLNNMAWALRRFPIFSVYGRGDYPVQPVYVEDLAAQAVEAGSGSGDAVAGAAGPETFLFHELLHLLAQAVGVRARLIHAPPAAGLFLTSASKDSFSTLLAGSHGTGAGLDELVPLLANYRGGSRRSWFDV